MPITIKRTIKIVLRNNTIINGKENEVKKAPKELKEAQSLSIRTKSKTQKYSKG